MKRTYFYFAAVAALIVLFVCGCEKRRGDNNGGDVDIDVEIETPDEPAEIDDDSAIACEPDKAANGKPCGCAEGYVSCLENVDIRGNETGDGGGYCYYNECENGYWKYGFVMDAPCYRCDYLKPSETEGDVDIDVEIETPDEPAEIDDDSAIACEPDKAANGKPCGCWSGYTACFGNVDLQGDGRTYCKYARCLYGYWHEDYMANTSCEQMLPRCDLNIKEGSDGDVEPDASDGSDDDAEPVCEPDKAASNEPCGCEQGYTICLDGGYVPPSEASDGGGWCSILQCFKGKWNYGQVMDAPCGPPAATCDYVPPKETDGDAAP